MKAAAKTFKRFELKYFVTPQQYDVMQRELRKRMLPDEYCRDGSSYMIYNIYFDTQDDAVIRYSLSKPYYKEKLRLRSYRIPESEEEAVFLELKKKVHGIVVKRRAVLSYGKAMELVRSGKLPETENYVDRQVLCEIQDFLERHRGLIKPKVYISYERTAFFGKEDQEFRISFDSGILTRRKEVTLMAGDYGAELLPEGEYLMEVKCMDALPLWLCSLLSELNIYETSFSKYGTEYKRQVS